MKEILRVYAGSISYGTNDENSDIDIRGVCIPSESVLLGLENFEQKVYSEEDTVIFSLKKFVNLALQNNPNILELLWVNPEHIIYTDYWGRDLLAIRDLVLSKRVYKTYGGYAHSQLKKMYNNKNNSMKHAMHLIRLLKMGAEILRFGTVQTYRPDRAELLKVKKGEYSMEEINNWAKSLGEDLEEAFKETSLPDKPNYNQINDWLVNMHKESLALQ